ncbi:SUMF1/EgtB/PvdO family nonheme iron enzyme [Desulfovibrio desulfuricans]|uniref:SUMF1/EgtB/PvdO family nonheme iron enzyme n=1 Tax=Desulfovibrio desulfuricans TaxID=876 RepID=UPI0003B456C7|nr:SUMF1/EgtB/PvdO family nonheme iron enzyme [Desulfovibrio desulfuricans]
MKSDLRIRNLAPLQWGFAAAVCCALLLAPCASQSVLAALARKADVSTADAYNPKPADNDIILPMPCGLSMVFKLVAVPAKGLLWDMPMRPGVDDSAHQDRAFYDRRYNTALSGAFTLEDLPAAWRKQAPQGQNYFYLVAKYEVSNLQWHAVMDNACPDTANPGAEAARPATDMSWYDAVDFTRRYTTWLLQNAPDSLPRFAGDQRNVGFVRLPTETEWEYAARGGQTAGSQLLLQEDFFALPTGESKADYAVYRPEQGARAEGMANIGSRKPNPLGIYDTAGNAAEMVLDAFRFSMAGRLHGSAGGFVRKGGSFLSGDAEILPGRREEMPFFLTDGPAHARDLGFRPVISGINTPGGGRPQELTAEWNKAGEKLAPLAQDGQTARNPLDELDRLLAAAPDEASRKNLQDLRNTIKENNIMLERQKQLEAQSLLRTGVYMIETIRNYSSRRNSLKTQIESMEREKASAKGAALEKLKQILDTANRGLVMLDTSIEKSLTFYRSKVEESALLAPEVLAAADASLAKDFSGNDPFNENMHRNLELYRLHVDAVRKNKTVSREAMQKAILERRFQ